MKILVTGSSGFVGRHLVHALIRQAETTLICHSRDESLIVPPEVQHFHANADAHTDWSAALEGVDVVVHLAARAHKLGKRERGNRGAFFDTNARMTKNLALQAERAGVRRFIFMSSVGVNGESTQDKAFTVDHLPQPCSVYAESKLNAEREIQEICSRSAMDFVILRAPLVYGPAAPGNFGLLVNAVVRGTPLPFKGLSTNKRSLIYVENLVDLILKCVWHPCAANNIFLSSDGEVISTAGLVEKIEMCCKKRSRMFYVPPRLLRAVLSLSGRGNLARSLVGSLEIDIEHTKSSLGWVPPVDMLSALSESIKNNDVKAFF